MLTVHAFKAGFRKQQILINDISFSVPKGSFCVILGENGSGKTTLVRGIMGLLPYADGQVVIDGQDFATYTPKKLAQKVAVLSQDQPVQMDFIAEEIVQLGRYPFQQSGFFTNLSKQDKEIIHESIILTNSVHLRNRYFTSLSGGERQRVLLAKAFAQQPKLLFLDEPTNHLDIKHSLEILGILKKQQQQGLTIVAILHDLNLAALYADQLVFLKKGRIIAQGDPFLLTDPLLLKEVFDADLYTDIHPISKKPQIFYKVKF